MSSDPPSPLSLFRKKGTEFLMEYVYCLGLSQTLGYISCMFLDISASEVKLDLHGKFHETGSGCYV